MYSDFEHPLSAYKDVEALTEKGHVMLVQNEIDGQLYVKKYQRCYNPEVYVRLKENPVNNTPRIYDIYENKAAARNDLSVFGEDNDVLSVQEKRYIDLIVIEEYISGHTLEELLKDQGCLSEKETIRIAMALCLILKDLHEMKPSIIHRDIKPSNIMVLPEGEVALLDFDAAKMEKGQSTQDTVLLGTAGFAAPEQYGFAASSPKTDIYALGVLMNIMLTLNMPQEVFAIGKMRSVIRHCLEFNPKDRFHDVGEVYESLKHLSKVKNEWALPGFRTMNIFKMVVAIVGYFALFVLVVAVDSETFGSAVRRDIYRGTFLLMGLLLIFFYCNFRNIRKWFPLMRSAKKYIRILGMILAPAVIFWGVILLTVMVELLFL